jgi:hypothetical protein
MQIKHIFLLGISVSLLAALPAWAHQSGGGGQRGSQRGGQSVPLNQPSRGMMQKDQLHQQDRTQLNDRDRDRIYGSQLMTAAERRSYRNQMRSLKTAQEREALRKQHHEQMQKRATERGMTLPDMPPSQGAGMGPGAGMQQRTQQQTEQQQQNQGQDQQIQQKQRTEQQTQSSKEDGNR